MRERQKQKGTPPPGLKIPKKLKKKKKTCLLGLLGDLAHLAPDEALD